MRVKPLVLVLDDDEFFRTTLDVVLQRLGCVVKTVATVAEFREAAAAVKADLFLIDLHLGAESGLVLIHEVRQTMKTPIIVCSGSGERDVISQALEFGANDYIHKPVDRLVLAAKLGQFFHTEEIDEQDKFLEKVQGQGAQAKITFAASITGVDELGLRFRSPHLVPKGAVIKLRSPFVQQLRVKKDECLVCVTQTSLDSAKGTYDIYAEFEEPDLEFLQSVRRWLIQHAEKKAA